MNTGLNTQKILQKINEFSNNSSTKTFLPFIKIKHPSTLYFRILTEQPYEFVGIHRGLSPLNGNKWVYCLDSVEEGICPICNYIKSSQFSSDVSTISGKKSSEDKKRVADFLKIKPNFLLVLIVADVMEKEPSPKVLTLWDNRAVDFLKFYDTIPQQSRDNLKYHTIKLESLTEQINPDNKSTFNIIYKFSLGKENKDFNLKYDKEFDPILKGKSIKQLINYNEMSPQELNNLLITFRKLFGLYHNPSLNTSVEQSVSALNQKNQIVKTTTYSNIKEKDMDDFDNIDDFISDTDGINFDEETF